MKIENKTLNERIQTQQRQHIMWMGKSIETVKRHGCQGMEEWEVTKIANIYRDYFWGYGVQFSSVTQSSPTLCNPIDCSTPGFPVPHQLSEPTQTHVHHVSDAIQPSHPLSSPSPPAFSLSQHQALFQWVSSSHQVSKVLEFQLQHQSFQ